MSRVDQVTMPKAAFDALMQQISSLQATVDRLTATIEEKDRIIAEKIEIILNQNRARFGQSSEKRTYVLCDGQLSMFEQAGDRGSVFRCKAGSPRIRAHPQTEAHYGRTVRKRS